jgi:hypothetical protein
LLVVEPKQIRAHQSGLRIGYHTFESEHD